MRLPIRIYLLAFAVDVRPDRERVSLHLRRSIEGALGRIEHQKAAIGSGLEVVPRNRNMALVESENAASRDHEIGDLSGLGTQHEIVDAAEREITRATNLCAKQLIGTEGYAGGARMLAAWTRTRTS